MDLYDKADDVMHRMDILCTPKKEDKKLVNLAYRQALTGETIGLSAAQKSVVYKMTMARVQANGLNYYFRSGS